MLEGVSEHAWYRAPLVARLVSPAERDTPVRKLRCPRWLAAPLHEGLTVQTPDPPPAQVPLAQRLMFEERVAGVAVLRERAKGLAAAADMLQQAIQEAQEQVCVCSTRTRARALSLSLSHVCVSSCGGVSPASHVQAWVRCRRVAVTWAGDMHAPDASQ